MAGFPSQAGSLGLKTQAAKGAYLDPGAVAPNQGVYVRYMSGSFEANRELLIPDPEIGGHRDMPDAALGAIAYSGEFDFYGRAESLAFMLKGCLGSVSSVTSGVDPADTTTHTITPADSIPWISAEENIGGGAVGTAFETFRYTDAKVNTFHMEAEANGYLSCTAGLIAIGGLSDTTPTLLAAQRHDTSPLMVGTNITVTYNAVQLPARSFSLDISNNIEDDDFRLGSLTLGDLVPKRRDITMSVNIRPEDSALWKAATYGSSASSVPIGGGASKQQVVITITSYENITGAAIPYLFTFTIPKAAIVPWNASPSGDDVLESDMEIRALRPDPAVAIMTTTIRSKYVAVP